VECTPQHSPKRQGKSEREFDLRMTTSIQDENRRRTRDVERKQRGRRNEEEKEDERTIDIMTR